ncbi:MAG: hypothetical protein ACYTG0_20760 [Planctomycetota bacterium]|jgi:hypothetical protein
MSPSDSITKCPICGQQGVDYVELIDVPDMLVSEVSCARCGSYRLDHLLLKAGYSPEFSDIRCLISAWIRRQNRAEIQPHIKYSNFQDPEWLSGFRRMGFPQSITQKLDALLLFLADTEGTGQNEPAELSDRAVAEIAARSMDEVSHLLDLLNELGYVTGRIDRCAVTTDGNLRAQELKRAYP